MNFNDVKRLIEMHFQRYYENHIILDLTYIQGIIIGIRTLCETSELLTDEESQYLTRKFHIATNLILLEQMMVIEDDEE